MAIERHDKNLSAQAGGKEKNNPKPNIIVARSEPCGLLLWSYERDSYYLVKDHSVSRVIEKVVSGEAGKDTINENGQLANELKEIGFTPDSEVRYFPNKQTGHLSAPLDFYFDYTWACNLRCGDCYNRAVDRAITMPDDQVNHVFSEMANNGIMRTHLAGGEPTLSPKKLENYLNAAKKHGIRASVNTNGLSQTNEVLDILFKSDLVSITFSVDGYIPQLHDNHRGAGNFNRTIEAVEKTVKQKKELGSKTQVQLKTIWRPTTSERELEGMVGLGMELGVDVVQFHNPERCLYHERGYYGKYKDQYYENLQRLNKLQKKYKEQINIWNVCNPLATSLRIGIPGFRGCIGGQELLALNPTGSFAPCLMNPVDLGNLFEEWRGDFSNFWQNSTQLHSFQETVGRVDPSCEQCSIYENCRGGSKVRSRVEYGNLTERDPLCPADYLKLRAGNSQSTGLPDRRSQGEGQYLQSIAVAHSL